ncbi:glyceraldehyde 3-phosphate dehydrogenase [Aureobasidium pullulans]|nr:glyceraldehyde 3-phosphate dehydrogenase [Aureobasidium pullulans]
MPSTIAQTPPPSCRIGINGFGRIGRNVFRASLLRSDVVVVAINHTCDSIEDLIYLIRFDSTHGTLAKLIGSDAQLDPLPNGNLIVNGREIILHSQRDLYKLDWAASGVDYVAECTGKFKTTDLASIHTTHGKARKVLISAPSPDAPTFVFKVNSHEYDLHRDLSVFSCASCTTNCLAPIAKVIDDNFGIAQGFMTTVHASTQSQHVLDGYSKKNKRAGRSVMGNIIPTTTGAAQAIKIVLPQLKGKLSGTSIRVPVANVSMVDLTINTDTATSLDGIFRALRHASETYLSGVLCVTDDEVVSCDLLGHNSSAIIDSKASVELNSKFFKIIAWYDNEWAYSCRLLDMLHMMAASDAAVNDP